MAPNPGPESHSTKRPRSNSTVCPSIPDRTKRRCPTENNDQEYDPGNTSNSANTVNGSGNARIQVGHQFGVYNQSPVTNNYYGQQPTPAEPSSTIQERRQTLVESLRFDQDHARRDTIKTGTSGSCIWLRDEKAYRVWLDAEHDGFLWIKGKPGAGKSVLMKFALSEAEKRARKTGSTVISFFFNARGNALEQSTIGMYRFLLWQLLTYIPRLQAVFDSPARRSWRSREDHEWSIEPLKELFKDSIQDLGSSLVTCFIDALDECPENEIRDMLSFLEDICEEARENGVQFRVCFSSRHYPHIDFNRGLSFKLEDLEGHDRDIQKYIMKTLKIGQDATAESIRKELQVKSSGVFLWVYLVVGILNTEFGNRRYQTNIKALQGRLKEMPPDLRGLFRDILIRNNQNRNELILCIQWVLFARQPLTPEQLHIAMLSGGKPEELSNWNNKVSRDEIRIFLLNSSKGLAEVTSSKAPTVQFIHESVREYLLEDNGLSEIWSDSKDNFIAQSHDRLKHCCATYMMFDASHTLDFSKGLRQTSSTEAADIRKLIIERFPFMEYAVRNILYHADLAEGGSIPQEAFIRDFPLVQWIKLNNLFEKFKVRRYTPRASLLYILAEHDLPHLIANHPSVLSYLDAGNERYGPPLLAAIATGSDRAVRAFWKAGMKRWYPNDMLQRMCDVYIESEHRRSAIRRNFKFPKEKNAKAYIGEQNSELLCTLFYTSEADLDTQATDGRTPPSQTTDWGYKPAIRGFLEMGTAKIDTPNWDGRTPLSYAAAGGYIATVKLLLETGQVGADAADEHGRTPLSYAASASRHAYDIVKILLETGQVNPDTADKGGRTPLSYAASNSFAPDIIKLLLEASQLNADIADKNGRTPLSYAATATYGLQGEEVIKLLLETSQVNADTADKYGRTPLSHAAARGYIPTVKLLLETGQVNADAADKDGRTPLSYATARGHMTTIKLLLETGQVNADAADRDGRTPLSYAADRFGFSNDEIIKLLLQTGQVNTDVADKDGRTPLSYAAARGSIPTVKLLLETGQVNADAADKSGRTPLSYAAMSGNSAVVKLLTPVSYIH